MTALRSLKTLRMGSLDAGYSVATAQLYSVFNRRLPMVGGLLPLGPECMMTEYGLVPSLNLLPLGLPRARGHGGAPYPDRDVETGDH
ncbi:hypothetical protein CC1G_15376 [Coprinopsis cinerea okayama7|uniref:Uncharacterized protein n=1 Tax=Coprinopsis cinerea (strain Okayama-7 / 130 / ATCC MYA-4618 / FGSC 9003) TaxID=240176 RepID=D6RQK7_COPC7|nr:hypothetical protein CC1G_15376 [Coprinopsis cinerea okayama7\|eukprot:XP_002910098.1 hypothetical protein CC1G_15376 [Coprinopsis cinerea okayama7\